MPRRKPVPHLLAPVGIAFAAEGTVIEPDGVAVIKGAKNRDNGLTYVEYATMVRIRKAMEFLADPACRVNEVANRVGVADSRYFSSIFKRYTGFTPSEFRKMAEDG